MIRDLDDLGLTFEGDGLDDLLGDAIDDFVLHARALDSHDLGSRILMLGHSVENSILRIIFKHRCVVLAACVARLANLQSKLHSEQFSMFGIGLIR